jgi:hypothetical protein
MYLFQERFREIVYIERVLSLPVGIVPKTVYPDISKTSIFWQPFPGPKEGRIMPHTP